MSYDSDSSDGEEEDYTETGVLLGYASKEPTEDDISQLGGHPTWLDLSTLPPTTLIKCKVCSDLMTLLLQLNGDLPEHFPGHERRLYLFTCRRKTCRRKQGSVRGFRGVRINIIDEKPKAKGKSSHTTNGEEHITRTPQPNIGDSIFGSKGPSSTNTNTNPFSTSSSAKKNPFSNPDNANPFATAPPALPPLSSLSSKPAQPPASSKDLPTTFAEKARISTPPQPPSPSPSSPAATSEAWPPQTAFPPPYPTYHLDADYETISKPPTPAMPTTITHSISLDDAQSSGTTTSKAPDTDNDPDAFESALDKTFLRFADRLSQNPLQILRYEFRGSPLLYSRTDAVWALLSPSHHETQHQNNAKVTTTAASGRDVMAIPRCTNCGAQRVFEVQLTPHAIVELEAEDLELGMEGMEWGTVILGVCERDCQVQGIGRGGVGYVEEWVGVQWEEQVNGSGGVGVGRRG
ncbi:hypothetical protein MMC16_006321 [Acarospora aff. strigata]|nr:hypothetical protein [Acarospora aff. strigata]